MIVPLKRVINVTFVAILLSSFTYEYDAKQKNAGGKMLSGEDKIVELQKFEKDELIKMTTATYKKYILRPNRPYHSFVLFTALSERFSCEICRYTSISDRLTHSHCLNWL